MRSMYEAVRIREGFYWVGAVDWGLRDFHGYSTHRGSTYNSFLLTVPSGRSVLFDAVKKPFMDIMLERVASVVDPSSIDIVVSNHAEMDHSGGLPDLCAAVRPDKVYASAMGAKNLARQIEGLPDITVVADGESIDIGGEQLTFIETRMLHWPDSMFSYLPARKLLVSQDAFGMHLATPEILAQRISPDILREEAGRYFANILLPYSPLIRKLLARVASMGLEIETIAPDHGPVWLAGEKIGPGFILDLYRAWSEQAPTNKAVVAYDTMWHSTEMMAHAIAEGLSRGGARPVVCPMAGSHRSDVAAELLEAGALFLGSPTINNNIFPTMADLVAYLRGLKRQNLVGAAFGSHGWSGEAVKQLCQSLDEMKVESIHPGLSAQFRPTAGELEACRRLGETAAGRLPRGEA